MIRLGKLTDYGLVLMTYIARNHDPSFHAACGLADSRLPLPTVTKLLKQLLQSGLLMSHRGIKGGYSLAKRAGGDLGGRDHCRASKGPWRSRNAAPKSPGFAISSRAAPSRAISKSSTRLVRGALEKVTLSDLVQPMHLTNIKDARGKWCRRSDFHPGEFNEFEYRRDSRSGAAGIQVGLRHRYRRGPGSQGPERRHHSPDLGQEE